MSANTSRQFSGSVDRAAIIARSGAEWDECPDVYLRMGMTRQQYIDSTPELADPSQLSAICVQFPPGFIGNADEFLAGHRRGNVPREFFDTGDDD